MAGVSDDIRELLENEQDAEYEEEIARNPYSLKAWLRYLEAKTHAKPIKRYLIYERALKFLPGSYKLWFAYLQERRSAVERKLPVTHAKYQILVNTYERALVHLSRMPRIWLDYCGLLASMKKVTKTRRAMDGALQSLPITQHHRVWELYLPWVKGLGIKEAAVRVFRRFLKYDPSHREAYVDYLEKQGEMEEAAAQLAVCVNDDGFLSPKGTSKHALWMRLCDMCAKHPQAVSKRLKVDAIIRSGLSRFTDETGKLWCKLADYYIRLGQFERARDVYEEALATVLTVRDFTMVFDAYSQCEEALLSARVAMLEDDDEDEEDEDNDEDLDVEGDDTELRLARLEDLMERRPVMLSSVLLRQNPHNVHEWHKRAKLFTNDPRKAIVCYTEAVKTVDPRKALGKPHTLWTAFAKFYEEHEDLDNARVILNKATLADFRGPEDLAAVYCAWAEMEIRHENYEEALKVVQHAVTEPSQAIQRRRAAEAQGRALAGLKGGKEKQDMMANIPVQERVHRSTRVWNLYLDLEESLGTLETTKAAYDRCLELKVATPQILLNYASFLEEHSYFEEAFRVYEKGVAVFGFPHVKPIWQRYLDKFVARYEGAKLERARDLFEQCLGKVPAADAAEFYIKYAKLEEDFGLARHAMAIYDRATKAVPEDKRFDMYLLYIKKVESLYGVTRTREVYQQAIETLPDDQAKAMCLEFAELERKLGEIDRARAIFTHGSNYADPKRDPGYWKKWQDFEVNHGNEETFRDMLRVKRTVQTAFSQVNYMAADAVAAAGGAPVPAAGGGGVSGFEAAGGGGGGLDGFDAATGEAEQLARDHEDAMRRKEREATGHLGGSVAGGKRKPEAGGDLAALERQAKRIQAAVPAEAMAAAAASAATTSANPEEIDLDDEMEEGDGGDGDAASDEGEAPAAEEGKETVVEGDQSFRVKAKPVPAAVFARAGLAEGEQQESKGALERLKGKK